MLSTVPGPDTFSRSQLCSNRPISTEKSRNGAGGCTQMPRETAPAPPLRQL